MTFEIDNKILYDNYELWSHSLLSWAELVFRVFHTLNPDTIDTIILYHGTGIRYKNRILLEGIMPRELSGSMFNDLLAPSQPNLVYLAGTKDQAQRIADGKFGLVGSCVFKVEVPTRNLRPDEDSHETNWYDSILKPISGVGHLGIIEPSKIQEVVYEEPVRQELVDIIGDPNEYTNPEYKELLRKYLVSSIRQNPK